MCLTRSGNSRRRSGKRIARCAAGELGLRTEEIKRTLDPIAENLRRVSQEVERLEQDRRTTHGQVRQMFESITAEVGRLRDQTGTLVSALKRPQVRGAWGKCSSVTASLRPT